MFLRYFQKLLHKTHFRPSNHFVQSAAYHVEWVQHLVSISMKTIHRLGEQWGNATFPLPSSTKPGDWLARHPLKSVLCSGLLAATQGQGQQSFVATVTNAAIIYAHNIAQKCWTSTLGVQQKCCTNTFRVQQDTFIDEERKNIVCSHLSRGGSRDGRLGRCPPPLKPRTVNLLTMTFTNQKTALAI